MNNLLPGKDSTKHLALPSQAAAALASTGGAPEWFCQPESDMHSGEFCSEGHGTPAKGLASPTGVRVRAMEPLGSQGAHAWLPALLGHGAAWHRDPLWAAPAPHPSRQQRRSGLRTVLGQTNAITHCQRCLCSLTPPWCHHPLPVVPMPSHCAVPPPARAAAPCGCEQGTAAPGRATGLGTGRQQVLSGSRTDLHRAGGACPGHSS